MAPVAVELIERRRECRRAGGSARWQASAVLRPGLHVTVINITTRAALVECGARLRPGARTEMQLACAGQRASVPAHLDRCYVAALDPLRYRGVVVFEERVDLGDDTETTFG